MQHDKNTENAASRQHRPAALPETGLSPESPERLPWRAPTFREIGLGATESGIDSGDEGVFGYYSGG